MKIFLLSECILQCLSLHPLPKKNKKKFKTKLIGNVILNLTIKYIPYYTIGRSKIKLASQTKIRVIIVLKKKTVYMVAFLYEF